MEGESEEIVEEKVKKPKTIIVKKSRDQEPKPKKEKILNIFERLNED